MLDKAQQKLVRYIDRFMARPEAYPGYQVTKRAEEGDVVTYNFAREGGEYVGGVVFALPRVSVRLGDGRFTDRHCSEVHELEEFMQQAPQLWQVWFYLKAWLAMAEGVNLIGALVNLEAVAQSDPDNEHTNNGGAVDERYTMANNDLQRRLNEWSDKVMDLQLRAARGEATRDEADVLIGQAETLQKQAEILRDATALYHIDEWLPQVIEARESLPAPEGSPGNPGLSEADKDWRRERVKRILEIAEAPGITHKQAVARYNNTCPPNKQVTYSTFRRDKKNLL
mgnify:CR=1 FL=1